MLSPTIHISSSCTSTSDQDGCQQQVLAQPRPAPHAPALPGRPLHLGSCHCPALGDGCAPAQVCLEGAAQEVDQ